MVSKFSNSNSDREYRNIYGWNLWKSMDFHKKSMKNPQNSNSDGGVPRDD